MRNEKRLELLIMGILLIFLFANIPSVPVEGTTHIHVVVTSPGNDGEISGEVDVKGHADSEMEMISVLKFRVDDYLWQNISFEESKSVQWNFTLDTSAYRNGKHNISVKAADAQDRETVIQKEFRFFNRDAPNTLPMITLDINPDAMNVTDDLNMHIVVKDPDRNMVGGRWRLGGFSWTEFILDWGATLVDRNLSWDSSDIANGYYQLVLEAIDAEGSSEVSMQIYINNGNQNMGPTLQITSPENNTLLKEESIDINGTTSDPDGYVSSLRFMINDGIWIDIEINNDNQSRQPGDVLFWGKTIPISFLDTGDNQLGFKARDNLGKWSGVRSIHIKKGHLNRAEARVMDPPHVLPVDTLHTFDGSHSDPSFGYDIVEFKWTLYRFGDVVWNVSGEVVAYYFSQWGIYNLTLEVLDSNDIQDNTSYIFRIGNIINLSDIKVEIGKAGFVKINFSRYITGFYQGIVNIEWVLEHGGPNNRTNSSLSTGTEDMNNLIFNYTHTGSFNLTLLIDTDRGRFTQTSVVIVEPVKKYFDRPPRIKIILEDGLDGKGIIQNRTFTLNASDSFDPDGYPLIFEWLHIYKENLVSLDPASMGKGNHPEGKFITLSLHQPGEHIFNLTITDMNGSVNYSEMRITIKEDTTDFSHWGDPVTWSQEVEDRWNDTFGKYALPPLGDIDGDGEFNFRDTDMDGDGFWNQEELDRGSDPTDPLSVPRDQKEDQSILVYLLGGLILVLIIFIMIILLFRSRKKKESLYYRTRYSKDWDFF